MTFMTHQSIQSRSMRALRFHPSTSSHISPPKSSTMSIRFSNPDNDDPTSSTPPTIPHTDEDATCAPHNRHNQATLYYDPSRPRILHLTSGTHAHGFRTTCPSCDHTFLKRIQVEIPDVSTTPPKISDVSTPPPQKLGHGIANILSRKTPISKQRTVD